MTRMQRYAPSPFLYAALRIGDKLEALHGNRSNAPKYSRVTRERVYEWAISLFTSGVGSESQSTAAS
jgi:hypothetical protein